MIQGDRPRKGGGCLTSLLLIVTFPIISIIEVCMLFSNRIMLFDYLAEEFSLYSTAYEDGREIISESFSAYYSSTNNRFAGLFIDSCIGLAD